MDSIRNLDLLYEKLNAQIEKNSFYIVGVDGMNGSGKTTLANKISDKLQIPMLSIDDFNIKEQEGYLSFIRYNDLKARIAELRQINKAMIIEGVCLLEVLENVRFSPDILIYLKFISDSGIWGDEYICEPWNYSDNVVERLHRTLESSHKVFESTKYNREESEKNLVFEVAKYHEKYKPTTKAHFFFERIEESVRI